MPALFIIPYHGNKSWHFPWKQQPAGNRTAALPVCCSVCCSKLPICPELCQISIIHFNTILFAKNLPLPRSQRDSKRKYVWSWLQRNTVKYTAYPESKPFSHLSLWPHSLYFFWFLCFVLCICVHSCVMRFHSQRDTFWATCVFREAYRASQFYTLPVFWFMLLMSQLCPSNCLSWKNIGSESAACSCTC